ncbi:MAG: acyl-CoA carboxylase subunit beta [Solirubrobacterales bacterium]
MTLTAPMQRPAAPPVSSSLSPRERLEALCDPGSFRALRSGVTSERSGPRAAPGDGVLTGAGSVGGRPVFCYSEDASFMGGSLGEAHADSIVRVMKLAGRAGAPVVGFVESGGARLQEGHAALAGYGRIFRESVELSSRAPQITVVTGLSAGGGAYSPALTDFVVMTERARMFLTGPKIVRAALGESVSTEDLGGPDVHERNGVCDLVAADDRDGARRARELLSMLPGAVGELPPRALGPEEPVGDPSAPVPAEARRVYDVREVIEALVDHGEALELRSGWARNMVTALARIDGRTVGVLANQPWRLGGVIDQAAAEKAALFVNDCDRFSIPLVVLVDTPGFMPGRRQEEAGVIRRGASLLHAFAAASVPRLTVVLRKAYGGAVITMNSKDLGADMVFAWPHAEIGIMAAGQAVDFVHRRQLADSNGSGLRAELTDAYADEHLTADAAAASGFVDEVIEPPETRARLAWALAAMEAR